MILFHAATRGLTELLKNRGIGVAKMSRSSQAIKGKNNPSKSNLDSDCGYTENEVVSYYKRKTNVRKNINPLMTLSTDCIHTK